MQVRCWRRCRRGMEPLHPTPPYPPPPPPLTLTCGLRAQVQAVLTLYAQGALTGLVVDSGDGVTHAVPVLEGYCAPHAARRLDVAGRHVTAYLADLLARRGYCFHRSADFDTVRQIKEKLCYMAYDYDQEVKVCARDMAVYVWWCGEGSFNSF